MIADEWELGAQAYEALHLLEDRVALEERFPALKALEPVRRLEARFEPAYFCPSGKAIQLILTQAIEPVASALPAKAATLLRVIAAGGTAAAAARELSSRQGTTVRPEALRKYGSIRCKIALGRWLLDQERQVAA